MTRLDAPIPTELDEPNLGPVSDASSSIAASAVAQAGDAPGLPRHGAWSPMGAFTALNVSHAVIDIYPIFFASLSLALKERLGMDNFQIALMFATGPIVSGLPQAFFAWATDKLDSRVFAWLGLLIGAVCICSIGFAQNFWQLWALQVIGLLGTGAYHPIGAALAGQLGGQVRARSGHNAGRAFGVSVFYTAGMVGGFLGAVLCTRINKEFGMVHLAWLMIPGFVLTWAIWAATHKMGHRQAGHRAHHASIEPDEARARWRTVWLLFIGNVSRFTVNTALPVLFMVWAESRIPDDPDAASKLNGDLLAALTVGMGIFGISAGRLTPIGREKKSMAILTVLGAGAIAVCGYAGTHMGVWAMFVAAGLSSLGFAAIIPTTISLAQRLLPGRTGLASGLMLGSSWGLSFTAPWLAEWFLGSKLDVAHTLPPGVIDFAFVGFAGLMIVALVTSLMMPTWLLKKVAV
jgi:MFS transporter, FSR family, fosmidomycin resistance protein